MQTVLVQDSTSTSTVCGSCGSTGVDELLQAPDRFHGRQDQYELVRCRSCSLVWLNHPPSPAEMGEHYGADYDRAIATAGSDPNHWTERRDILLKYKSGGAALDLGCSSGGFLSSLRNTSWELYGIEMSPQVARQAEARSGAQVFVGDILDAPFLPSSFDAITCFHVFEHLYEPRAVLKRVSEWLKPDGIFFVMVPNIDSAGQRMFKSYWYALELPRHLYHFSPVSLRNVAASVGLSELSITTHRELFVEKSVRYVVDDIWRRVGKSRTPLAKLARPSFPRRAIRKGFRMTMLPILNALSPIVGDGESIHAIFTKK